MTLTPALQWTNLSAAFGERVLFRGFSGSLLPGEKLHLLGPSGSGKSTFLKIIMGFCRDFTGSISISGIPLTAETVWDLRSEIAWLPQEADIAGFATAGDFIRTVFSYASNRKSHPEIHPWLEALHLRDDLLERKPEMLSGGEKQRLALASVLALNRRLILLDEPLSALDPKSAAAVSETLSNLSDTAVLAVSHVPFHGTGFHSMEMGV